MNAETSAKALLSGCRIVECVSEGQPDLVHIATAFAGRLLVDLGAEVLRLPPRQDPLLRLRSDKREAPGVGSLLDAFLNRGKSAIGATEVAAALGSCDLALLSDAALQAQLPRPLPGVVVSALPQKAEPNEISVSQLGIQGLVGLTDLFGEPGDQPLMMGGHQSAYATGFAAFCAMLAALAKYRLQGETDVGRVNAVDALAWVNWKGIAAGTLGFPIRRGGRKAEAPVLKCTDGYFAFLHLPNNWSDIREAVNDQRLDDERFAKPGLRARNAGALNEILAEWAASRSTTQLFEFCQRCAIPGGPVMFGRDLLQDPLYLHRHYFDTLMYADASGKTQLQVPSRPLTLEAISPAPAKEKDGSSPAFANPDRRAALLQCGTPSPAGLPLAGVLVLDLGIFTAGSVTSTLLADLGARVIKVESASYSDPFRIWPGIKGDSPLFTFNNRNKLGVNLDLKTKTGKARFLKLVSQADIVVENFRRGVLERLGIDFPVLQAANPKVCLVSISGQGASGPGSGHVSFGSTLEALGGIASLTGYPAGPCYISGRNLNYPDQIVCLYGAGAAIAALLKARQQETGLHIDVSQREVTSLAVGEQIAAASRFAADDSPTVDTFPGNSDINAALQDVFAVTDGWLCVTAVDDEQLMSLSRFLGCEQAAVTQELSEWLAQRSSQQAIDALRVLKLAVFEANTGAQAAEQPLIKSGSAFSTTRKGAMVKGFPFQFDGSPMGIYEESPAMGEHTDRVIEILGD